MRALYESVKEEKSKADKMFEELGYKKRKVDDDIWYYMQNGLKEEYGFYFNTWSREITPKCLTKSNNEIAIYINMQELKAINQKCKELKWI